jgi:enoyl-CoA hydratase/carnithine racemase
LNTIFNLVSAGGTQRLSRAIGVAKAKELIFTGRIVSAKGALEDGNTYTQAIKCI